MLTGLIIIAGGLLTALYPPQLSRVVVSLLILTGATLVIRPPLAVSFRDTAGTRSPNWLFVTTPACAVVSRQCSPGAVHAAGFAICA